ncbi:MAG: hypothetical protein M1830_008685 [Pleopsidium flavum]|nr:MAG: hypothetical protein M1830_008685 [Pleopsidium flavum]
MLDPIVQYHGKWPFYRFFGIQEPFSVLFSLFNFLAHQHGLRKIRESIPRDYSLRRYYILLGYFGMASWVFSMMFHTRDFGVTEKADYFAAGAGDLQIGPANAAYETDAAAVVDYPLHRIVYGSCLILDSLAMGLYLQHGRECGDWNYTECAVELV